MASSKPGTIECNFFEHNSNGYTCEITSLETHRINTIIGKHLPGKSNNDVTFFTAKSQTLQFLPENLHKIFSNLEYLAIESPEFNEIFKKDLEPFGANLRTLSLTKTRLEDLPVDLFEANPLMGHLYVESSVFKHINKSMFDSIPKLFFLGVKFPGYSIEAFNSRKIENAIRNLDIRVFVKDFEHKNLDRKKIIENEINGDGPKPSSKPPVDPTPKPTPKKVTPEASDVSDLSDADDEPSRKPPVDLSPKPIPKPEASDASDVSDTDDVIEESDDQVARIVPPSTGGEEPRGSSRSPCGWITAIISFLVAGIGGLIGYLFLRKSSNKKD